MATVIAHLSWGNGFAACPELSQTDFEIDLLDVFPVGDQVSEVFDLSVNELSAGAVDFCNDNREAIFFCAECLEPNLEWCDARSSDEELGSPACPDFDHLSVASSSDLSVPVGSDNCIKGMLLSGDSKPFILMSSLIHFVLLLLLVLAPNSLVSGSGGQTGNAVLVSLIEQEEVVPQDMRPGSRESAGSLASVARRRINEPDAKIGERLHREQEPTDDPHKELANQEIEVQRPLDLERNDNSHRYAAVQKVSRTEQETASNHKSHDWAVSDASVVESMCRFDSAPSLPSIASPERSTKSAAGKDGEEFKSRIVSAIYQAAYYPRKALRARIHGEAVVSFTLWRNGSVTDLLLKKPSGSEMLDEAAIKIVKKASEKFPNIPDTLTVDSVSYEVPIIFRKKI